VDNRLPENIKKSLSFDRELFMLQRLMLYYTELCHSKGAAVWL